MHLGYYDLTLRAVKEYKANLLIHKVFGMTKPGDIDHYTRVCCLQALFLHYPQYTVKLSLLPHYPQEPRGFAGIQLADASDNGDLLQAYNPKVRENFGRVFA